MPPVLKPISPNFEEPMPNLEELEAKVNDAKNDGAEYQTDADRALIANWEAKLKSIKLSASFLEHPETESLLELAREQIRAINNALQNDRDLAHERRLALFEARDIWQKLRSFFDRNPEKDAEELEADIDEARYDDEA